MDGVLLAHKPYPAFAVDRHWNIVLSNGALPQLYEGCSEELLRRPVNAMRLIMHPAGLGSRIINYGEWRSYSLSLLRHQAETSADSFLRSLLAEIAAYPSPHDRRPEPDLQRHERLATPLRIATRFGEVAFLNTITVFGTPNDVTLSELALEMLFPADAQTIDIVGRMLAEQAERAAPSAGAAD
jgi:hypothetical protein